MGLGHSSRADMAALICLLCCHAVVAVVMRLYLVSWDGQKDMVLQVLRND